MVSQDNSKVRKTIKTSSLKIGSHTFPQYVAKRLHKDGIGFVPIEKWEESSTDCHTYIRAPIPKTEVQFLVYCHELGHCKSYQPHEKEPFYNMQLSGQWSNARLESEHNAWVWALRYFKRIGFKINKGLEEVVIWSLEGYLNNAVDKIFAKILADRFKDKFGITVKIKDRGIFPKNSYQFFQTIDSMLEKREKRKEEISKPRPENWKHWHDLKRNQIKRQWKYQK